MEQSGATDQNTPQSSLPTAHFIEQIMADLDNYDWAQLIDFNPDLYIENDLTSSGLDVAAASFFATPHTGEGQVNHSYVPDTDSASIAPLHSAAPYHPAFPSSIELSTHLFDHSFQELLDEDRISCNVEGHSRTSMANKGTTSTQQAPSLTGQEEIKNLFSDLQRQLQEIKADVQAVKKDSQELKDLLSMLLFPIDQPTFIA